MNIRRGLIRVWMLVTIGWVLWWAARLIEEVYRAGRTWEELGARAPETLLWIIVPIFVVIPALWWAILYTGFWIARGFRSEE